MPQLTITRQVLPDIKLSLLLSAKNIRLGGIMISNDFIKAINCLDLYIPNELVTIIWNYQKILYYWSFLSTFEQVQFGSISHKPLPIEQQHYQTLIK